MIIEINKILITIFHIKFTCIKLYTAPASKIKAGIFPIVLASANVLKDTLENALVKVTRPDDIKGKILKLTIIQNASDPSNSFNFKSLGCNTNGLFHLLIPFLYKIKLITAPSDSPIIEISNPLNTPKNTRLVAVIKTLGSTPIILTKVFIIKLTKLQIIQIVQVLEVIFLP